MLSFKASFNARLNVRYVKLYLYVIEKHLVQVIKYNLLVVCLLALIQRALRLYYKIHFLSREVRDIPVCVSMLYV